MHRRLLIALTGCLPLVRLLAQEPAGHPHQKVSADALRQALLARFPVHFAVPGLFDAQVDARELILLPARQRLGATLVAKLSDLSTQRVYPYEIDLTFAIRYEAADRSLRAHDLEISRLHAPGLPPEAASAWQALVDNLVRSNVDEVVLHRFSRDELQFTDVLGFQPEKITVEEDGVEIWFEPKPRKD